MLAQEASVHLWVITKEDAVALWEKWSIIYQIMIKEGKKHVK
jgi:hypothetical protein